MVGWEEKLSGRGEGKQRRVERGLVS